jgi:hypothetical protein
MEERLGVVGETYHRYWAILHLQENAWRRLIAYATGIHLDDQPFETSHPTALRPPGAEKAAGQSSGFCCDSRLPILAVQCWFLLCPSPVPPVIGVSCLLLPLP